MDGGQEIDSIFCHISGWKAAPMTMKKTRRLLFMAGIAAVLCCGGLRAARAAEQAQTVAVRAAPVTQQDVPQKIRAVGTVLPYQAVAIRSRLDSQIMEVKFHDGDAVKKGDILFVLDDRALKAQRVQTQANLDRDRAQLDNATRQYQRLAKLGAQGYASHTDLDNAQAAQKSAAAALGADQAALENINVQLDYTVITAPITGRTGTINVTVGNNVKANDVPLVTINQIQPILMQASLPQDTFDKVRSAMQAGRVPAVASREGVAETENGALSYIDNAIDQSTGTFVTRAVFDNANEHLWPGMLGTLTIEVGSFKQALTVPEVAIQHNGSVDFVFVIADGKARKQDVKLTQVQDGLAIVGEGLRAGDQVAVDGMMSLQEGSAVTVAAAAAAAAADKQNAETPAAGKSTANPY
jgi:membrane fusion protein, multidrug efflux system